MVNFCLQFMHIEHYKNLKQKNCITANSDFYKAFIVVTLYFLIFLGGGNCLSINFSNFGSMCFYFDCCFRVFFLFVVFNYC